MAPGGGFKVGFETDGVEDRPGGETCGNRGVARGFGVDRDQTAADFGREPQIDVAITEAFFPDREQRRIEVLHGEEAGLVVTGEHGGSGAGEYPRDHFQPVRFVAAARYGGPPFVLDAQLSQSPLDHENAVRRLHLEDIGGDAARQSRKLERLTGRQKPEPLDLAARDRRPDIRHKEKPPSAM